MKDIFNELKSYKGRFSRSQYWSYSIGVNLIARILMEIIDRFNNPIISLLLLAIVVIPSFYFTICIYIKRSHDLGKSGYFILLTGIPFVNLYPFILFAFVKGTDGENEYGSDSTSFSAA